MITTRQGFQQKPETEINVCFLVNQLDSDSAWWFSGTEPTPRSPSGGSALPLECDPVSTVPFHQPQVTDEPRLILQTPRRRFPGFHPQSLWGTWGSERFCRENPHLCP